LALAFYFWCWWLARNDEADPVDWIDYGERLIWFWGPITKKLRHPKISGEFGTLCVSNTMKNYARDGDYKSRRRTDFIGLLRDSAYWIIQSKCR